MIAAAAFLFMLGIPPLPRTDRSARFVPAGPLHYRPNDAYPVNPIISPPLDRSIGRLSSAPLLRQAHFETRGSQAIVFHLAIAGCIAESPEIQYFILFVMPEIGISDTPEW